MLSLVFFLSRILCEETEKREQLEKLKEEQDALLRQEQEKREHLEQRSEELVQQRLEQARQLEVERERLRELEGERRAADEKLKVRCFSKGFIRAINTCIQTREKMPNQSLTAMFPRRLCFTSKNAEPETFQTKISFFGVFGAYKPSQLKHCDICHVTSGAGLAVVLGLQEPQLKNS